MKTFQIDKNIEVVCESQKTRYGFRHLATLLLNGREVDKAKVCYYNRTWESYEFETVLRKLVGSKALTKEQNVILSRFIENPKRSEDDCIDLGLIGGIAAMGGIIHGGDPKLAADWKLRMIKAGLENRGLEIPEDWDTLTEEEKNARLDGAIKQLIS